MPTEGGRGNSRSVTSKEVVFVERIAGRHAVPVLTRVGGRFALHATGVGLVLLAHAPADVQDEAVSAPLHAYTEKTVTDPRQPREILAGVRKAGYAVSDGQVTTDALSVAAPIQATDGTVVAAVSLVVRAEGAQVTALAQLVQTAARGISRSLAAPAGGRCSPASFAVRGRTALSLGLTEHHRIDRRANGEHGVAVGSRGLRSASFSLPRLLATLGP